MNRVFLVVVASALLVAGPGCDDNKTVLEPDTNPTFVVSPDSITISDHAPNGAIYVASDRSQSIFWRVTGKPTWASVDPESGTVGQTPAQVAVHANATGLTPGVYSGKVSFISSAGAGQVGVSFLVAVHPLAEAFPTALALDANTNWTTFRLRSTGTGPLQWTASVQPAWASVVPADGWIAAHDSMTLTVAVNRAGIPPGTETGSVVITSNSEGGTITVPFTIEVPSAPRLAATPDSVTFDYFVNTRTFTISNNGNAPLSWNGAGAAAYLNVDPASGALSPGQSTTATVTINRTGLSTGTYTSSVLIASDAGQSDTVGVRVKQFQESKWLLDYQVIDAEFSPGLNRIVAVVDAPPALLLLDPESRAVQSVPLPLAPNCVAAHPDSGFAAVGHNGYVTYVDLNAMAIIRTYALTADALDIVLPPNGWVYVFPQRDQWTNIRCINLSTGQESNGGGLIYAGMRGRLHPSGDYIYGADNNLSPSDFYKFDVQPGVASLLWDSPYHGDYATGGDLWFSEDGVRLFGRSGDVFNSSSTRSLDMTYSGHLAGLFYAKWITHSSPAARIFALSADSYNGQAPPEIRVYGSEYLAFLGVMTLPPFLVPNGQGGGTLYNSKGQYVFTNEAGTRLYTMVRAATGSGLAHDWAVVVNDISSAP